MSANSSPNEEENRSLREEIVELEQLFPNNNHEPEHSNTGSLLNNITSHQVQDMLSLQDDSSFSDDFDFEKLRKQPDLKNLMEKQLQQYKQKVFSYQFLQRKQATIINDLEKRVEEYRNKCSRLEAASLEYSLAHDSSSEDADLTRCSANNSLDFDTALLRLEQEKCRSQQFFEMNSLLRAQVQTATDTNRSLTLELQQLTEEWQASKLELDQKEAERKREEETFSLYCTKEHQRLLSLWKHVLNIHSEFTRIKHATEKDLSIAKTQVERTARIISDSFLKLQQSNTVVDMDDENDPNQQLSRLNQEIFRLRLENETNTSALSDRIQNLTASLETKDLLLAEKERINNALNKTLESVGSDFRKHDSSASGSDLSSQSSLMKRCCRSVKDIAEILVQDSDHKSWMGQRSRSLSPVRRTLLSNTQYSARSLCDNQEFVQSTVKAVQSSLRVRQSQVEELSRKLSAYIDNNKNQQALIEDLDKDKQNLTLLITQLSDQLATVQTDFQMLSKEKHAIQASLQKVETQKSQLEYMRKCQESQIDSLNSENERLRSVQNALNLKIGKLEEEKDSIKHSELVVEQDLKKCNRKVSALEETIDKTEKQIQESEHKLYQISIDKDILQKEKDDLSSHLDKIEKQRSDLDSSVRKLQSENDNLKNTLTSLQNQNESLIQERDELNKSVLEVTGKISDAVSKHSKEKFLLESEKQTSKESLDSAYHKCEEFEKDLASNKSTLESTEATKLLLEEEKANLLQKNNDLMNQVSKLTFQKQGYEEEVERLKKENSRNAEGFRKLGAERDKLARANAELTIKSTALDVELAQTKTVLTALKDEKEQLEKTLYIAQQLSTSLEEKKYDLEIELENKKSRIDFLEGQISEVSSDCERNVQLSNSQIRASDKRLESVRLEYQTMLDKEQQQHQMNMDIFIKEKDAQRVRLEEAQANLVDQLQKEKEDLLENHNQEIELLKNQNILHEKEIGDRLKFLVSEKEKIEKQSETDKKFYENMIKELEKKTLISSENRNEMIFDASNDHHCINEEKYAEDVKLLKEENHNNLLNYEKSIHLLEDELEHIKLEKESVQEQVNILQQEIQELQLEKVQSETKFGSVVLGIEDEKQSREDLEQKILVLQQRYNSQRNQNDAVKKSHEDFKERFCKAQAECSELRLSVKDLWRKAETLENEHRQEKRENDELRNTLHEVEKSRMGVKRDYQALCRRFIAIEATNESKDAELKDLRLLMEKQEEIEADLKNEIVRLKQKVMEAEAIKEAATKELNSLHRKMSGVESKLKYQHQEHNATLQEALSDERSNAERCISLERTLTDTMEEVQDLRLKLNFAEGKIVALETQISKVESGKREAEHRLHSLHLSLRSSLGLGSDSGFQGSPSQLLLSPFSSRRESPMKLGEPQGSSTRESSILAESRRFITSPMAVYSTMDLDHELVKSALRDLLQKMYSTEKEKDELRANVSRLQRELEQIKAQYESSASKFQLLQRKIEDAVKDKKNVDDQLAFSKATVSHYEDLIQNLQTENRSLTEQRTCIAHSLAAEKNDLQNKIAELKIRESKLQLERSALSDTLETAESRALRAELQHQDFESEQIKYQQLISLKNDEIEALEKKVSDLKKAKQSTELNVDSMKKTIDRLNVLTEKLRSSEGILRVKISQLEKVNSESSFSIHLLNKEVSQLKGEHKNCEYEKNTLKTGADNLRSAIAELKQKIEDLNARLKSAVDDTKLLELQKVDLEGQIQGCQTIISFKEESEKSLNENVRCTNHEKFLLEEQLNQLKIGLTKCEDLRQQAEKQRIKFEKENGLLRKAIEKTEKDRLKTEEIASRSLIEKSALGNSLSAMETENQQLMMRVQNLRAQLAEVEQRHLERIKDLDQKQKFEIQLEVERERSTRKNLEQMIDVQNKLHRQKVHALEQHISSLHGQLSAESRKKTNLSRSNSVSLLHEFSNDSLDRTSSRQRESRVRNLDISSERPLAPSPIFSQSVPSRFLRPTTLTPRSTSTPRAKRSLAKSFQN